MAKEVVCGDKKKVTHNVGEGQIRICWERPLRIDHVRDETVVLACQSRRVCLQHGAVTTKCPYFLPVLHGLRNVEGHRDLSIVMPS